jgi:hypothetical protein
MVTLGAGVAGILACYRPGFWQYMIARNEAKRSLERQRAQDDTTALVLRTLPAGATLFEQEADGRIRFVRLPPTSGDCASGDPLDADLKAIGNPE